MEPTGGSLVASTTSSVVSIERASSTVIVPSLPTFSIASAMILPIDASELAEIDATSGEIVTIEKLLKSATDELINLRGLVAKGLAPAPRLLAAERTQVGISSNRKQLETSLLRAKQNVRQTEHKILEATRTLLTRPQPPAFIFKSAARADAQRLLMEWGYTLWSVTGYRRRRAPLTEPLTTGDPTIVAKRV